jgi:hypothetical protein
MSSHATFNQPHPFRALQGGVNRIAHAAHPDQASPSRLAFCRTQSAGSRCQISSGIISTRPNGILARWDRWPPAVDQMRLTAGASKEPDIHAHTIERVCRAYPAHRKAWLRWRGCKSLGVKSLGGVPFNTGHVSCDVEMFTFRGVRYETSVPNTSWAGFRHMLSFKAMTGGGMCLKVNEVYTSQVYSCCGVVPEGRPRGITDLGIRGWTCDDACGAASPRPKRRMEHPPSRAGDARRRSPCLIWWQAVLQAGEQFHLRPCEH